MDLGLAADDSTQNVGNVAVPAPCRQRSPVVGRSGGKGMTRSSEVADMSRKAPAQAGRRGGQHFSVESRWCERSGLDDDRGHRKGIIIEQQWEIGVEEGERLA